MLLIHTMTWKWKRRKNRGQLLGFWLKSDQVGHNSINTKADIQENVSWMPQTQCAGRMKSSLSGRLRDLITRASNRPSEMQILSRATHHSWKHKVPGSQSMYAWKEELWVELLSKKVCCREKNKHSYTKDRQRRSKKVTTLLLWIMCKSTQHMTCASTVFSPSNFT